MQIIEKGIQALISKKWYACPRKYCLKVRPSTLSKLWTKEPDLINLEIIGQS